jgi:hypothetical protein
MTWEILNARDSFERYSPSWDEVNRNYRNHILLDASFWRSLVKHFASQDVRLAMNDGRWGKCMALVERSRAGFWRTFQPGQAPLGPIIFDELGAMHWRQHLDTLIAKLPGYALGFSVTQQDPDFTCFDNGECSPVAETLDYIQTPRLTICGKYEDYWKQRSKNLTHNLSRQRRRLKEQGGALELAMDRGADAVPDTVREYGLLESGGWKGEEGSAVATDNIQGRFYREMLEKFCGRGETVMYRLRLNGKTVASDLCLERDGTLIILKTAYDESIQGLSLGLLLHQELFQRVFSEARVRIIEFYGQVRDWHWKWTNETRTMYHFNLYRHCWVPRGKRLLRQLLRSGTFVGASRA